MLNFFLVLVDVLSYKLAEFISYSIMVASYIKKSIIKVNAKRLGSFFIRLGNFESFQG